MAGSAEFGGNLRQESHGAIVPSSANCSGAWRRASLALAPGQPVSALCWQQPLLIAADHPSLPGHFPGQPIVPGVLLLQHVAEALRSWRGQRLARLIEVKFLHPLLPAQAATLTLSERGGRLRFEICREHELLARGLVEAAVDE